MRLQATLLLVALLAITPAAYAVDPGRGGGAVLPPSGGAAAPDPTEPDPAEPSAPTLVPLDSPPPTAGGAENEGSGPPAGEPSARAAQGEDPYTEVQVPIPAPETPDSGSAGLADAGLADTGMELPLVLAAGMSLLGAGLLVLGLVRRPH